ncbi:TPA: gp53-like domain-containing protein, partial [Escherichia coli]
DMSSFVFTGQDVGSYKLPGGFIIQWANLSSLDTSGWTLVNFQNAWPTKILGAIAINEAGSSLADKIMGVKRLSDTQLQITAVLRSDGSPALGGAYVIAWGYSPLKNEFYQESWLGLYESLPDDPTEISQEAYLSFQSYKPQDSSSQTLQSILTLRPFAVFLSYSVQNM